MLLSFSVCTMLPSHLCFCLFRSFTRAETLGLTRKSESISLESPGSVNCSTDFLLVSKDHVYTHQQVTSSRHFAWFSLSSSRGTAVFSTFLPLFLPPSSSFSAEQRGSSITLSLRASCGSCVGSGDRQSVLGGRAGGAAPGGGGREGQEGGEGSLADVQEEEEERQEERQESSRTHDAGRAGST